MKAIAVNTAPDTENLVALLSRLAASCEQDAKRFERASREVTNEELALLFGRYSRRRSEFAKELSAQIDRLEGRDAEPVSGVRVSGRRGAYKQIGRRDDGAILCDCEHAEKGLRDLYEEALRREVPGELQMVLRRQFMAVSDVYDQMHDLCEALAWCAVPMAV